jgi:hypothetical protein
MSKTIFFSFCCFLLFVGFLKNWMKN